MTTNFTEQLNELRSQHRLRQLQSHGGVDFTSNNYLLMSQHPALRKMAQLALADGVEIGAAGSRLLRGNANAHVELEHFAADYFDSEAALFFANGFIANQSLFSTLPDRHDVIIFDALIHASARDGIQSSSARHLRVTHNDLDAVEEALQKSASAKHRWIAVESIYSMDGDIAPLAQLHQLAHKYDATLIVDEAHATGVFGKTGKGLTEDLPHDERLITLHTCGKALGVAGGLVCTTREIIDYMINKSRAFIYSTAPMPLQAVLVKRAMELCIAEPERREQLWKLQNYARQKLGLPAAQSQIFPITIGSDARAVQIAEILQQSGFDIRAIRPPTVPEGTARLRLALNIGIREQDIDRLSAVLNPLLRAEAA